MFTKKKNAKGANIARNVHLYKSVVDLINKQL